MDQDLDTARRRAPSRPELVLIGLGANLPSARFGAPTQTCAAALAALVEAGLRVLARSRWYESAPVPASDQPWYVNGVASVDGDLSPRQLLELLHAVEREFGRERRAVNAPRVIDLDLLAFGERVNRGPEPPLLPHPRLADRAFVLLPLAELAPSWRHPVTGAPVARLIAALPSDQVARPLPDEISAPSPR